jgi:sodium transport system ATP-binding protein
LLGTNGAGKTILLRLIGAVDFPTSGTISVTGFDTREQTEESRQRIGYWSGETKLYDRLTPGELLHYYSELDGMDEAVFFSRRQTLFASLLIEEFAERKIGKLTIAQRRKVFIARAMILDPDVVVLDEPFIGINETAVQHIAGFIKACRTQGKTVIFSTHVTDDVALLADDLAILHRGQLRFAGTFSNFQSLMKSTSLEEEFIRFISVKS